MNLTRCYLLPGREKSLLRRHPWVFSGALKDPDAAIAPGETVELCDHSGKVLATAAWSPESQLRARVWSFEPGCAIDAGFFRARIAEAVRFRRDLALLAPDGGCRLIYSESDHLPGVIVDRYADVAAVQFTSAGAERFRDVITAELLELPFINSVYERSDAPVRAKEGLAARCGALGGKPLPETLKIVENGLTFETDLRNGQKTGFYFDLRPARELIKTLAAGRRVLNVFSYTGGFACAAFAGNATEVVNVDASSGALKQCVKNLQLNGFTDGFTNICGDAFTVLRQLAQQGEKYDLVILDPPKLIPHKGAMNRGCRGYQDLARCGFKLLAPGGILCNFSCSGLMDMDLFQKITASAALEAQQSGSIIHRIVQSPDHPVRLEVPETFYLKGLATRIDNN